MQLGSSKGRDFVVGLLYYWKYWRRRDDLDELEDEGECFSIDCSYLWRVSSLFMREDSFSISLEILTIVPNDYFPIEVISNFNI